jgi:glycerate dehydrogenase
VKIVVLDARPADQGTLSWDPLRSLGEAEVYPRPSREELLERAAGTDALLTNKVLLDAETIAALPALRYVGIVATGTNGVDLAACRERGIAVTNVPGYSTASVAQLVFALLLHLTHDVAGHNSRVKASGWATSPDFMFCTQPLIELEGKTLVVVGLGAIGKMVAGIARAFGMQTMAAQVPGSKATGRTPLAEALAAADVVTLHCPLTPATRGLVGRDFLRALKPGGIVVNTGRGALVDEGALLEALASGSLGGALLDVLEREPPPPNHPLLYPNASWAHRVVVTPHIGWATVEARERLVSTVIENLAAFVRGESRNRVEQVIGEQAMSLRPAGTPGT